MASGGKIVVTDGSKAHKSANRRVFLPHSRHVLDRFHFIGWLTAGFSAVRRDVQRRQPDGIKPVFDP